VGLQKSTLLTSLPEPAGSKTYVLQKLVQKPEEVSPIESRKECRWPRAVIGAKTPELLLGGRTIAAAGKWTIAVDLHRAVVWLFLACASRLVLRRIQVYSGMQGTPLCGRAAGHSAPP